MHLTAAQARAIVGEIDRRYGVTRDAEGTVERTVFWADNSIETFVKLDEGGTHIIRHKAPSGDLCY